MLRVTGWPSNPSQCFIFRGKETWQKSEVFSHSLIQQAQQAGIKWENVNIKLLGALHARSYWTLQYWEEETLHIFTFTTQVLWGAMMWGDRKPAYYQKLTMRNYICGQEICFISSCNKYTVVNSTHVLCFTALLFHILHRHVDLNLRTPRISKILRFLHGSVLLKGQRKRCKNTNRGKREVKWPSLRNNEDKMIETGICLMNPSPSFSYIDRTHATRNL